MVIQKDGLLFYRRSGQPDTPVPYRSKHYGVFLSSAKEKRGMTRVIGPAGEEAPTIPEEEVMPRLIFERLAAGEEVYRLVSNIDESSTQEPAERTSQPQKGDKAVSANY